MKKVFVMMILILTFGVTSIYSLNINSVTYHGADGASDTILSLGETVTVNFTYTAGGPDNSPISINYISIWDIDWSNSISVTEMSSFSGATGNVTSSITFTMPAIPSTCQNFNIEFSLITSNNRVAYNYTNSTLTNDEWEDNTLPVELSAFDAIATAEDFVNINWTVQSETNISGYFIIRGLQNDIETAQMIPAFINATNGAQEHSYSFTDKEVTTNNIYFYWLQSVEFSLETELFGPTMVKVGEPTGGETVPVLFGNQLIGNYPNPFNPSTSISFSVANPEHVTINVFNVKGQLVKNLYDSFVSSNRINQRIDVLWNGKDNNNQEVASGVYYSKMNAGKFTDFKKMLLIK